MNIRLNHTMRLFATLLACIAIAITVIDAADVSGSIGAWPATINAIGATTSLPGSVTLNGGSVDSALFSFLTPTTPTRNRFQYMWNLTLTAGTVNAITSLRSCDATCATPQPSFQLDSSKLYDALNYFKSNSLLGYGNFNPRFPLAYYPFKPANAAAYPNCQCDQSTVAANANPYEAWWLRLDKASAATTVTATATVVDMCNGVGDELPLTNAKGCACDNGWYGSQCGSDNSQNAVLTFYPCCTNKVTDLSSLAGGNLTVTNASLASAPLRTLVYSEQMFSYSSGIDPSTGVSYDLYVRNLQPGNPVCQSNYPGYKFGIYVAAVCDEATNLASCFSSLENTQYSNSYYSSDIAIGSTNVYQSWNNGDRIYVPFSLSSTTRTHCGCSSTETAANPLKYKETKLVIKVSVPHSSCSYEISANSTQYCLNGGTYYPGTFRGCACLPGYGGMRCENQCTATLGGPDCDTPIYTLSPSVAKTFTSSPKGKTYFTIAVPPPNANGNPRMLRVKVSGATTSPPTRVRITGKEFCDSTTCIVAHPQNLATSGSSANGGLTWTPWPFDYGSLDNTLTVALAYSSFAKDGYLSPSLTGGIAVSSVSARGYCGCIGKNTSAPTYTENWNLLVSHTEGVPSTPLTITVDTLDVCNNHGWWDKTTKTCFCETGYGRGATGCAAATSYASPCCLPCTNTNAQFPQLNCSEPLTIAGADGTPTIMPQTNDDDRQTPGTLPGTVSLLFPAERAIVHYPSLPSNHRGNPWLVEWKASLAQVQKNSNNYDFNLHVAGVRTCARSNATCAAMVPGVIRANSGIYSSWDVQGSSVTMLQPYDIGSYETQSLDSSSSGSYTIAQVKQIKLEFNSVSYWMDNSGPPSNYQYQPSMVGNTSIPDYCLCQPTFYESQENATIAESAVIDSGESWTFASDFLWGSSSNQFILNANFSDICAGHGTWRFAMGERSCECDADYFGLGCLQTTTAYPYNNLYGVSQKNKPLAQCCTAKYIRPPGVDLTAQIYDYTARSTVSVTHQALFPPGNPYAVAGYGGLTEPYFGVAVFPLDPNVAKLGMSHYFFMSASNSSSLPTCPLNGYTRVNAYAVCGNWTIDSCLKERMSTLNMAVDGQSSGNTGYSISFNAQKQVCGCQDSGAIEHSLILMLFTSVYAPSYQQVPCAVDVSYSYTTNCPAGQGVWSTSQGFGTCICEAGWSGTNCATKDSKQYSTMTVDTQRSSSTMQVLTATNDMVSGSVWGVMLPLGAPQNYLNLQLNSSCTNGITTNIVPNYDVEILRCFDQPQQYSDFQARLASGSASRSDSLQYYSPDETFAYVTGDKLANAGYTLNQLSQYYGGSYLNTNSRSGDNPFRHCDQVKAYTGFSATGTTISINSRSATIKNTYGQPNIMATGITTSGGSTSGELTPNLNSICYDAVQTSVPNADSSSGSSSHLFVSSYGNPQCLNTNTYYIMRITSSNIGTCTTTLTQTSAFTCNDGFITCGGGSQGGCRLTNATDSDPSASSGLTAQCGPCSQGFEGVGCNVAATSYREMVNMKPDVLTSRLGEPMRLSLQVSPTNSAVNFKLKFVQANSNCTACRNHVGRVWIRARLGSAPPTLNTRMVTDEKTRTVYITSDGTDQDLTNTLVTSGSSTGAGSPDMSSTGAAAASQYWHGGFNTLSTSLQPPAPRGVWHHFTSLFSKVISDIPDSTVYRNDLLTTTGDNSTISFPTELINAHAYLYLDVYHSNMMDISGESSGKLDPNSDQYATSMEVEISISDPVGTLVGSIALAVLGGFLLIVLIYLIYLRCRYGSLSEGVQHSVLDKAKVSRVAPIKSPKQMEEELRAKMERRKKRMERLRKGQKSDEEEGICTKSVKLVALVIAFAFLLLFEILKVLFNISILHTSIGSYLPVVDFDAVAKSVGDSLRSLGLGPLEDVWARFNDFFDFLGIFNEVSLKWNCGGALSMFAPVVILLGSIVLVIVLQKDYFLRFSLSLKGSSEGSTKFARKLRAAAAGMFSTFMLYTLQSSILVLTQVVASTWNIKRSCSEQDAALVNVGRYLCIVFIVLLFYIAGLVFAGIKELTFNSLVVGWFSGVWALLQLTVGIWRESTVSRFDIAARARDFDLDDNHDENPEEAVMELQAASRGLMWTAFPVGIVLTKVTEQINAPPFLIVGNYLGVSITTPRWNRGLKWIVGMAKMLAVFYTVWSAEPYVVTAAMGLTALSVFLMVALPNDYHRRQWEAAHPVDQEKDEDLLKEIQMTGVGSMKNNDPAGFTMQFPQEGDA